MLRPAFDRITSSIASTANYGFARALSFTDSFNEQTSLLLDAALLALELEPTSPSSLAQEAPAVLATAIITDTLDIEPATPATRSVGGGQEPAAATSVDDEESKRVGKSVQTVCLFSASASLLLFVNLPTKAAAGEHAVLLYSVNQAFVCLVLFTSLGLSMFSTVARPGEPAVVWVQKRGMVAVVASVLVAFTLRMCVVLPTASLEYSWLVFVLLAGAVAVCLSLAWKFGGGRQRAETTSGFGAGVADAV